MRYESGGAFRQALEDRLRQQSLGLGTPLIRLRKMVAFERLLARLSAAQPGNWLLKGGLALQWRLGNMARTTQDLDLSLIAVTDDAHQALVRAALLDIGDWFRFLVQMPTNVEAQNREGGLRFHVQCLLDARSFETFHLDVRIGDPVVEPPELLVAPPLLEFAGIKSTTILCYPVTQHIAEKVHAYTRPHVSGESSRVKDLVDLLLIAHASAVSGSTLSKSLQATFAARVTHALPASLPHPPAAWTVPYRRMATDLDLPERTLSSAAQMAGRFLDPILGGEAAGEWDPRILAWRG